MHQNLKAETWAQILRLTCQTSPSNRMDERELNSITENTKLDDIIDAYDQISLCMLLEHELQENINDDHFVVWKTFGGVLNYCMDIKNEQLKAVADKSGIVSSGTYTMRNNIVCPYCETKHIDEDEWAKRLHRSHLCKKCGHVWQPYDEYTFGV